MGTVDIVGSVDLVGTVDILGSVDILGTVDIVDRCGLQPWALRLFDGFCILRGPNLTVFLLLLGIWGLGNGDSGIWGIGDFGNLGNGEPAINLWGATQCPQKSAFHADFWGHKPYFGFFSCHWGLVLSLGLCLVIGAQFPIAQFPILIHFN